MYTRKEKYFLSMDERKSERTKNREKAENHEIADRIYSGRVNLEQSML